MNEFDELCYKEINTNTSHPFWTCSSQCYDCELNSSYVRTEWNFFNLCRKPSIKANH